MKKKDVAVLFISGQSNAHAHGQVMKACDRIVNPLANVFSLDRNQNQSLSIDDVVWSGFTTEGKNLGESQDNTYSLAYFFAKLWQEAIDRGKNLPNLYIIQISIGSQGIVNGMWNPDKEKIMIPGALGKVDISLFPWALQVNRLAMLNLKRAGNNPIVIGWHWLGSEQDVWNNTFECSDFQQRYNYFFDSMLQAIGEPCPLFLYKLYLQKFCEKNSISLHAIDTVNEALLQQCNRHKDVTVIEAAQCSYWDVNNPHFGIFAEDDAHYLAKVQRWFAEVFYFQHALQLFVSRVDGE